MTGRLNDILPQPISKESEEIILDLLKRKMKGAAGFTVRLLRAMEERFGPAAREVVKDMAAKRPVKPRPDPGGPQKDLREFCDRLERGCVGSHRWTRVVDEPDRIGYHFTRCMWAEVFRELGEPDLGFVICAGDEPAVKSHNPKLSFQRSKVLMKGDEVCDHVFFVQK
ncbi:MAG: hypothetical protein FJ279_18915 [Planctomycetes bacterium]|nr:hypothetical protein [Planctomycetota bacterium]MBM4079649.1 hypothetical protein [Planctomycetota bacterium]